MGDFERYVNGSKEHDNAAIELYLDYLETERQITIMRLRAIDKQLVRAGRLQRETLPTRIR